MIGCWDGPDDSSHIRSHLSAENHPLAVEMQTGMIFCSICSVFVWNATMDLFSKSPEAFDEKKIAILATVSPSKKKKQSTGGDGEDADLLKNHCVSMRGMVNLGNTCFMASVLQVLLHCKPLRAFFMSMGHDSKGCSRRALKSTNNVCIACEFDDLFTVNYCGEISPHAPTQFLHAMWCSAKNLSGYEQQDAHEFLISILGQIHTDLGGSTFACKCPVHASFTGVLQSDVTCLSCGNVNASFDPFIDVSLDVLTSSNDSGFVLDPNTASLNLHECFHMFTHAERLSSNTYMCSTCNHTYQEATKQMSIRKAPQTLTVHLKRFEHSLNTVKIDTFMEFPLEFSIFDYTTEGVHLNNELTKISSSSGDGHNHFNPNAMSPNLIDPAYEAKKYSRDMLYRLVATVNHTGVVDSGHYISYIANDDQSAWFKFDDAMVTKVSTATVLSSNAYMLFYERIGPPTSDDQSVVLE
jgi:ubiquitin carboxyl-terminal hydrolase 22/27/51